MKQYIGFQKQPVGGALKVLDKSSKTVFDKDHKIKITVKLLFQNSVKKYEDDLEHLLDYLYCRSFVMFSNVYISVNETSTVELVW